MTRFIIYTSCTKLKNIIDNIFTRKKVITGIVHFLVFVTECYPTKAYVYESMKKRGKRFQ